MSIHERMSYPLGQRHKKDTCDRPKPPCKKLDRKRKRLSSRRNAHSQTLASLPSSSNPAAFRQPGSMKQGS